MKKKIFSSLLMGAFLFASTSMITSCKDYDDDINDLKALVNQNSTALDQAKQDLQGKIDKLTGELSTLQGEVNNLKTEAAKHATKDELKAAIDQEIKDRNAAIAALESKIADAYVTKEQLTKLIGGELTGDLAGKTYKEAVEQIYANLESVSTDLGKALKSIASLEDPKTGWKAVDADLKQQINAINKYLGKYGESDPTVAEQLKKLKEQIAELQNKGYDDTAIKSDINQLKEDVKKLNKAINEINTNLNVLNVLIQQRLRSLVFIPDAYYWGIEATSFNYLDAFQYKLAETAYDKKEVRGYEYGNKPFDDKVSDDALKTAGARTDHKDGRYDSTAYTSVMDLWANYHLNPSDVIIDQINDVQVIDADKDYVLTRASEA